MHQSNREEGVDDEIPTAFKNCVALNDSFGVSPLPSLPLCISSPTLSSTSLFFLSWILHHTTFALQSLCAGLLPRALAVDVEAHIPLLVQVEELLKELGYIVVGLS